MIKILHIATFQVQTTRTNFFVIILFWRRYFFLFYEKKFINNLHPKLIILVFNPFAYSNNLNALLDPLTQSNVYNNKRDND